MRTTDAMSSSSKGDFFGRKTEHGKAWGKAQGENINIKYQCEGEEEDSMGTIGGDWFMLWLESDDGEGEMSSSRKNRTLSDKVNDEGHSGSNGCWTQVRDPLVWFELSDLY